MESETLADDLLSGIQGETLQYLLNSVCENERIADLSHCHAVAPLGSTGLSALDTYLSSVNSRDTSLNRGDILEIQGASGSGKTHLVYLLLTACLLPRSYRSLTLPGWESAAVVYDSEGSFDMCRFTYLLSTRIHEILQAFEKSELPEPMDESVEKIANQCCQRLFVSRPTSTIQLATSILSLPDLHADHAYLRDAEIGLLVVDSLSTFYWNDRFLAEQLRGQQSVPQTVANPIKYVLDALQRVKKTLSPVIVLTNWGLTPLHQSSHVIGIPSPFYKQHLHLISSFKEESPHTGQFVPPDTKLPSMPDNIARMNLTEPTDTAPPAIDDANSRFSITHQITLQHSPRNQLDNDAVEMTLKDWQDGSHVPEKNVTEVQGFIRTVGVPGVGRFSFST